MYNKYEVGRLVRRGPPAGPPGRLSLLEPFWASCTVRNSWPSEPFGALLEPFAARASAVMVFIQNSPHHKTHKPHLTTVYAAGYIHATELWRVSLPELRTP